MKSLTITLFALGAIASASAQIDSVKITERVFNDDTDSTLTTTNSYPSLVQFHETSLDGDGAGGEFANRHVFALSGDGGASAYAFTNDTFFDLSMDVTLSGLSGSVKEAGFLIDSNIGGQGQFLVKSDGVGAGEIAAFGGALPFAVLGTYSFGTTVNLGIRYFSEGGVRKITYSVDGVGTTLPFTNLEQGIIDGATVGGYAQFTILGGNVENYGDAKFENFKYAAVPEPASMAALALGAAAMLRRRRRV